MSAGRRVRLSLAKKMEKSVADYISGLLASERFARQVTHHQVLPALPAVYATPKRAWSRAVANVLQERGITALYSHQAAAADLILAGRDVVVATPTASGKTLCYSLPILEQYLENPDTCVLMLFPLKALAQDQMAAFRALTAHWPAEARPSIAVYDGDTSAHFRRKIRQRPPNVLITNPEMLHLAILPYHEQWAMFLASLGLVVVDEVHTCRGVYGAHVSQLFRRLLRVCGHYSTVRPNFVLCTATVGNPEELAANLIGNASVTVGGGTAGVIPVITQSGAPTGKRHFVFIDPENSPATTAIALLKMALERNLRTIVYCRSRRMTELIALWAADKSGGAGSLAAKISAYRAGFLPEERRDIEARMNSGQLLAVVTTSALELGIDIGNLDICILVGYPGTVISTWQRGGRVGRNGQESAVVLIAGEDALDQYVIHSPEGFFSRGAERAVLNPDNEVILKRHLECAAAEMPLRMDEPWLAGEGARVAVSELERDGLLLRSADGLEWFASRKMPQRSVDLRGGGAQFSIMDTEKRIIGSVDGYRAFTETHPGAVYLHRGRTYVVKRLDMGTQQVHCELPQSRVNWHTRVRTRKETAIIEVQQQSAAYASPVGFGRLRVTETILGYEQRSTVDNRLLSVVPLDLPPLVFETEGLWFCIPDGPRRAVEDALLHFMGSIHALEHASIGLMPLMVMADRNDFGGISTPMHGQTGFPTIFVYDGLPGGAGLCRAAFPELEKLFLAVRDLLLRCPCERGCPSCVHSPKCGSGNRPIDKQGALFLLERLITGEKAEFLPEISGVHKLDSAEKVFPEDTQQPGRYMVLDVETRRSASEVGGWGRASQMGVSVAVLYDSGGDVFCNYTQDELPDMFRRLQEADLVVGFNSLRFDYAVLQPFANYNLRTLPTLDLLEKIRRHLSYRISLDNVARATLDAPKSADGLQALRWWKEGNVAAIVEYCRQDVLITRDVYLYGHQNGHILFSNKAGQKVRIPVEW